MLPQQPTDTPLVSVVLCVIDPDPVYFPAAVRSILVQTLRELELIIVEEPSGSSAGPLLAAFSDPRIRHLSHSRRTSLAEQRNRGLAHARAELVACQDADDISEPTRLEQQLAYMRAHPEVAVLGAQLRIIDPAGTITGSRRYPTDSAALARSLRRYNPLAHPSVIYRKPLVQALGGYREEVTDDYELWIRLLKHGAKLANLPEALVRYRIHPGAMKVTRLRATLQKTIELKQAAFRGELDAGDRLRLWAEKLLLRLPPRLVLKLFEVVTFR